MAEAKHVYGGAHRAMNEGPNRQPGPTAAQIVETAHDVKALVERTIGDDPAAPERVFVDALCSIIASDGALLAVMRGACIGKMREQQAAGLRGDLSPGMW